MLFEIRTYTCKPGKRDEWVKWAEEKVIPFQVAKGVVVVGSFVSSDDPDVYVWIRRFSDQADKDHLYKAVYEDPVWKSDIGPRNAELLFREKAVVTNLTPTPHSVIR
ncbi:MAG: NIPSNAP family protein [Betaproteobacteria bacterium]